jgi:hypothetical protein
VLVGVDSGDGVEDLADSVRHGGGGSDDLFQRPVRVRSVQLECGLERLSNKAFLCAAVGEASQAGSFFWGAVGEVCLLDDATELATARLVRGGQGSGREPDEVVGAVGAPQFADGSMALSSWSRGSFSATMASA